ncbi:MAG TPA: trigger factor [Candidatus Paceibacterota bacterium]
MTHALENVKVVRDESAWEVSITAEIPVPVMDRYREQALKEIQKNATLDGFRPGHAPIERIIQVYGEAQVMRQAAELAIQNELPEALAAEKLPIVETPRVSTDAPEAGKPLVFTARAALAPQVVLPDYKALAKKHTETKEDTSVSDQEHADAMLHLRRERARIDKIETGVEPQKAVEESKMLAENDLPALDDMFVQSLGYESAAAFSEALRKNIQTEKELRASEKRRASILDDLVKESTVAYPTALREYELDEMEARLKDDLSRMGQGLEAYLAQTKKTREQVREGWKEAADKRAKVRLILAEIARKENIEPPQDALEHELEHARRHYKDADPDALRTHIAHAMRNEATLRFLEGNTEKVGHTAAEHI